MKILHVLDHSIPFHSGYSFRTRAILRKQRDLGLETAQITSAKHAEALPGDGVPPPLEEDVEGFRFYRTPRVSGMTSELPLLNQWSVVRGLARRLGDVISREMPDIVHAHSPVLNGLAASQVAKRRKIPCVYEVRAFWEDAAVDQGSCTEGDLRYRTTRALETYVMKQADALTCICDGLRNDIVSRGISPDKVTVIPNAVDIEEFAPGDVPDAGLLEKLGLTGMKVLGFVGSFYAFEGLDLLVKTLPAMIAVRDDIRVLLVGGGQEETRLRHQAQALGVADKVLFIGRVPHDQVHLYYDLIDILVYPRAKIRLTELVTPLKPLEAMARRRLVLASDVGGHRELIREGWNGFLFRAGDQKDLADRVLSLFQDPSTWHRVRSEARRFVEEERNWGKVVSGYVSVYQGVLPKGRSTGRTREFSHLAGA